ncbi:MAG: hypothetical protein JWL77_5792 [Chthonomonadaceae bacterium]|nr:hypothetical protein [Chthonomonadaceae bacterium]
MLDLNNIQGDDLIGAIHVDGKWHFCLAYLADWIMDYEAYDPGSGPSEPFDPRDYPIEALERNANFIFRNNIYTVDESNVNAYIDYLLTLEISAEDTKAILEHKLIHTTRPLVVIDFDKRLFVNGTGEVAIHDYVPAGWLGIEGNPVEYIPDDVNIWPRFQEAFGQWW